MEASDYNFYNGGRNETEHVSPLFSKPSNSNHVTEFELIKEVANTMKDLKADDNPYGAPSRPNMNKMFYGNE